jgi:hypothetical protein
MMHYKYTTWTLKTTSNNDLETNHKLRKKWKQYDGH